MKLKIYRLLTSFGLPFIWLLIILRKFQKKEHPFRYTERFGKASVKRPFGKLIWFHAASVGESISVMPVLNALRQKYPDVNILMTTVTLTAANLLAERLPAGVIHQFIPFDRVSWIKRFLKYWRPHLAVFIDSELWPNTIEITSQKTPMILLNARLSDKSFAAWQKNLEVIKEILSHFSLILPQSRQDEHRYKVLGGNNVKLYGNLKFASKPFDPDPNKLEELRKIISDRIVFLAASTHSNEEDQIANVHSQLRKYFPNLLTIIAPRHPKRKNDIMEDLKDYGLSIAVRSEGGVINSTTDIYLADTIGELGIFYSLAQAVFVGGSLIPFGGHNLLEPARYNTVVVFGQHMTNFKDAAEDFVNANAAIMVKDDEELFAKLYALFTNENKSKPYIKAAQKMIADSDNIIPKVINILSEYIERTN